MWYLDLIIGDQRGLRLNNSKSSQSNIKELLIFTESLKILMGFTNKILIKKYLDIWIASAVHALVTFFVDLNSHHLLLYLLICFLHFIEFTNF